MLGIVKCISLLWLINNKSSTILLIESQSIGIVCHSSMSLGVSPSRSILGLISIMFLLSLSVSLSPRSNVLWASCEAVVVLPHHLGPSIKTAPFPASFLSRSLSAMRFLYIFCSFEVACTKILIINDIRKEKLNFRPFVMSLLRRL